MVYPDTVMERVETAEQGLARLAEGALDLVLCDQRLGGMSGIGFVRDARARHPDLPIIILTAYGDEETVADALRAGASDYLAKARLTEDSLAGAIRLKLPDRSD